MLIFRCFINTIQSDFHRRVRVVADGRPEFSRCVCRLNRIWLRLVGGTGHVGRPLYLTGVENRGTFETINCR